MNISPLSSTNQSVNFGSKTKKVQYLYHLTTRENYEKIKTSGLKLSKDKYAKKGIFMLDLKNLLTQWQHCLVGKTKNTPLDENLMGQISKGNPNADVVLLRIPIKKLDKKHLKIRSQNELFENLEVNGDLKESAKNNKELMRHIKGETPISEARKHGGEALEFIYSDKISAEDIKKIGEMNLRETSQTITPEERPIITYLKALTQGNKKETQIIDALQ